MFGVVDDDEVAVDDGMLSELGDGLRLKVDVTELPSDDGEVAVRELGPGEEEKD